jgi:hypothetical protein
VRRWPEAALCRRQLRKGYTPAVAQVAAVANASTAPMNITVSTFDKAHMGIRITQIREGFIKAARLWKTAPTARFIRPASATAFPLMVVFTIGIERALDMTVKGGLQLY